MRTTWVLLCVLVLGCFGWGVDARAADAELEFDVPLAPFCVDGTHSIVVTTSTDGDRSGTLTLVADERGRLTGVFAIGAEVFALKGKQKAKRAPVKGAPGLLSVKLVGATDDGAKVVLKGTSSAGTLIGAIKGKLEGAKLARKSTFAADFSAAPAMVARCKVNATIDDTTGAVSGVGTVEFCGVTEVLTLTGKSNLPAATAKGKRAKGSVSFSIPALTWKGKGPILLFEDSESLGFSVNWSATGQGVRARGKAFRVGPAVIGISNGHIELTGSVGSEFNPSPVTVVLQVVGAVPSAVVSDFSVTNNTAPVSTGLQLNRLASTITLPNLVLTDGQNTFSVSGKDSAGLDLDGTFVLWGGPSTLVVTVTDPAGVPVPGAAVVAKLGDDRTVTATGTTDASGQTSLANVPDRTIVVEASTGQNAFGSAADLGTIGNLTVVVQGFEPASPIDNNDFATGDASGWTLGTAPAVIIDHTEVVGPAKSDGWGSVGLEEPGMDYDLQLNTSGEGARRISRTFATKPNALAVKLRYRFVTSEVPGGYFGSKFNDYFSVSIRSQSGGGNASESNTMNGLGLAAFDAGGATGWREVTLPLNTAGDTVQLDVTVANVADGLYDSYVVIDYIRQTSIDLVVTNPSRKLLETNGFEVKVDPPGSGSNFKIEIRRASAATWFTLGTKQVEAAYKQRVAGTFKLRGKATIDGKEETTQEKDLVVTFPTYADIVGDAAVATATGTAWTNTKAAATATTRREEAFYIRLNTASGAEKYEFTATVVGPLVANNQGASVNPGGVPADSPAAPSPIASATYSVGLFHTHTPTFFRPFGRAVGPSGADNNFHNGNSIVGVVYDYVGDASGNAPARWPLNSPAGTSLSGPNQRPTPP